MRSVHALLVVEVGHHCHQGPQGFGVGDVLLGDHCTEQPHDEAVEQIQKVANL